MRARLHLHLHLHLSLAVRLSMLSILAATALSLTPWSPARATAGNDLSGQRLDFAAASLAVAAGRDADVNRLRRNLDGYVLAPYLDYAWLRSRLRQVGSDQARDFLDREGGTQLASRFRGEWLVELARRDDWRSFAVFDTGDEAAGPRLRCLRLRAAIATAADAGAKPVDTDHLKNEMLALWATGSSLPDACDPAISHARDQDWLVADHFRQRLALAQTAGNDGLMAYLARQLPEAERQDAERLVAAVRNPETTLVAAAFWSATPSARAAAVAALERRARQDVDRAIEHWLKLAPALDFNDQQRQAVLRELALFAAVAYRDDAADWFEQVRDRDSDGQLLQWQVRAALASGDWQRVLAMIARLPADSAADSRWRYWQARALAALGERDAAATIYRELALEAGYHGFLAADRLGLPYALCPLTVPADPALTQKLHQRVDFQRALELHAVGWLPEATRAWNHVMSGAPEDERLQAVRIADERGWHDRAIWMLAGADTLGYYRLRFPLAQVDTVQREAASNELDPSWVLALIRAESAWRADARSHADARGLMQLLPATGQRMARDLGLPWTGAGSLADPVTNIRLGSRYLARQLERFGGSAWLASAAYNAGPRPVERWLAARAGLPADLFIETIPYSETRDYVPRLMAFSVIYDWRLHGKARPLSLRLLMPGQAGIAQSGAEDGTATAASHPFACAAPVAHRPDSRTGRVAGLGPPPQAALGPGAAVNAADKAVDSAGGSR